MKHCPYCKAEIQDNARFCLYCMHPLADKLVIKAPRQKKPAWVIVAAVVMVLALTGGLLWAFLPGKDTPQNLEGTSGPSDPADPTNPTTPINPSDPSKPIEPTEPAKPTEPEPTKPEVTEPELTEPQETEPTEFDPLYPPDQIIYEELNGDIYNYRLVEETDGMYDVYGAYMTPFYSTATYVLTGVHTMTEDGVYTIPGLIEYSIYYMIAPYAFSGTNAKAIYIPWELEWIHSYAFDGCTELTDVYINNSVYLGEAVFPPVEARTGTLTIHCPKDAKDMRTGRFLRDIIQDEYGAVWVEWDG